MCDQDITSLNNVSTGDKQWEQRKIVIRVLLVNPRANSPNQYHENYIAHNYWWDLESELDKMWMSTKFS